MPKDRNYDSVFLELCNIRCDEAECDFNSQTDECLLFSNEDVENAMDNINSGKARTSCRTFQTVLTMLDPHYNKHF